ncbi:hypothetical protein DL771_005286 [Monosporascus sp. 5C6A]|nr:hypothetical protein DL771_005286 [Monosporascus sp. 5C6A]
MEPSPSLEGEPEYILPEPQKEVQRLTDQDSALAYSMNNKRVLAPLDTSRPGLKILDSATADGLFLRSIEPLLTPPFTLSGFDIMPSFFPLAHPSHTSYAVHNIAEEWPAEMHGQYDFVHQRISLLGVGRTVTPQKAVEYLTALVKPGGWIQLGENDLREQSSGGRAMNDAMAVIRALFKAVCGSDDFAHHMADWLRAAGFEDVCEESFEIQLGPRCQDPLIGQRGTNAMLQSCEAWLGAAKRFNVDVEESVTNDLFKRMEAELTQEGGSYKIIYVWGRKPQSH